MTDYTSNSGRSQFGREEDNVESQIKNVKSTIGAGMDKAGEYAHQATEKVGEMAHDAKSKVGQFAQQATEKLSATADYLRGNNMSDMKADLEGLVKRYPTHALVGAIAVGFLAARAMRRD